MADMTGGCLCGEFRYTVAGEPEVSFICHCRECKRCTGSSFQSGMRLPADLVSLQGELKTFDFIGGSGRAIHRHFCAHCGSGVANTSDRRPGVIIVMAGTLDDPSVFSPEIEIFCEAAQPWCCGRRKRNRFAKGPPT